MTATASQTEERLLEAVIRVQSMGNDISEIKGAIREMALAVNKLAVFEERQMHDRQAINTVVETLKAHNDRLGNLELSQPLQKQTTDWAATLAKLVIGAVVTALLATVVIGRKDGPAPTAGGDAHTHPHLSPSPSPQTER